MRCLRRKEKRLDSERESERISWREKPGGENARKESLRESESQKREELELSEAQGMCPWNPGIKMMSRWRFDIRTHLAGYIIENQDDKKRKRDIHIGQKGPEAAGEEQVGEDSTI